MSPAGHCAVCGATFLGRSCPSCSERAGATASTTNAPAPGQTIDKFELLELLGRGGMGMVFKAKQKSLNRIVAVKVLAPQNAESPEFQARFEREAMALATLSHPHIVTIHDFGRDGDRYFLAMEYVDGPGLRGLLNKGKPSVEETVRIVAQICDALEYAHGRGIVHRDIKPENILTDTQGRARITDFGLAKILSGPQPETLLTEEGQAFGTPVYMSPEQSKDSASVDHRSDLYSLGLVAYEMWTGQRPLARFENPLKTFTDRPRIGRFLEKAMADGPADRHQSAAEFRADFLSAAGAAPPPVPASSKRWPKLLAAIGAAALLAFLGLLLVPRGSPVLAARIPGISPVEPVPSIRYRQGVVCSRHPGPVRAFALAPGGEKILSGGPDGSVPIRDVATGKSEGALPRGGMEKIWSMAFSPDGATLVIGEGLRDATVWDWPKRKLRFRIQHDLQVVALDFSPDGQTILTGGREGKVVMCPVDRYRPQLLASGLSPVLAVRFLGNASLAAVGTEGGKVLILGVEDGRMNETMARHGAAVTSLAVSPDGKTLITGSSDRTMRIWETATGRHVAVFPELPAEVRAVAMHPEGSFVAAGTADGAVTLWHLSTRRLALKLAGHEGAITGLAFDSSGKRLFSSSEDGTVRVWLAE